MTLALCGCPNCGKTTLFNLLTDGTQRTGNWPGVTVDIAEGVISDAYWQDREPVRLIDLPGVTSLTPFSPDEEVPLRLLRQNPPDAVIVVIDSCDPAQGLSLLLQLFSLQLPMIAAFSMADALRAQGGKIALKQLEAQLYIPCVLFSARQEEGLHTLLHCAQRTKEPRLLSFPDPQARWRMVDDLLKRCFSLPQHRPLHALDRILLHPFWAYPALCLAFSCVFFCAFGLPGQILSGWLLRFFNDSIDCIARLLAAAHTPPLLQALLTDGLMRSMAGVFSFLPVLLIFFFCTALMEDSGYLSRAAFILDGLFERLHLSGRSFFPLITGCGCSVPAILSAQALPSSFERRRTARLIALIPCSAKLPVILYLAAFCLHELSFPLVFFCYALCFLLILFVGRILPAPEDAAPLLMDFPILHRPTLCGALRVMRNKTRDFITRAFTLIFFTSVIVWLLQSFTPALGYTDQVEESLLFYCSRMLLPVLQPLGLTSPYLAAALIAGLMAKENILSVLALAPLDALFPSPAAALSFLTFCLLYSPCISACAALSQIFKSRRHMLLTILLQTALAWLAAFLVFQLFNL